MGTSRAHQSERIQREFAERIPADEAVERLRVAGFGAAEVNLSTHGGRTLDDGTFVPGSWSS